MNRSYYFFLARNRNPIFNGAVSKLEFYFVDQHQTKAKSKKARLLFSGKVLDIFVTTFLLAILSIPELNFFQV